MSLQTTTLANLGDRLGGDTW